MYRDNHNYKESYFERYIYHIILWLGSIFLLMGISGIRDGFKWGIPITIIGVLAILLDKIISKYLISLYYKIKK